MKIVVTGGAGFIGSSVIKRLLKTTEQRIVNVDKLTYAGNLETLKQVELDPNYIFEKVDICDKKELARIFDLYKPTSVMHLAAESHVDRSIDGPGEFIQTNIIGTFNLLEVSRAHYDKLTQDEKIKFKFHHVSTDEVYGDLGFTDKLFTESTPYSPSSPYSAAKASSDHLVRAWSRTFKLPVVITNCSNNYGPFQFPEKLIPVVIEKALSRQDIPVYGKGDQVRDWLFVEDHAKALIQVLMHGVLGETYNIGGHNEKANIDVVRTICKVLDESCPKEDGSYSDQISFVQDRPGHDVRYAIDASKIKEDLGWIPEETFESGLKKTVEWYLSNQEWVDSVKSGTYRHYYQSQRGQGDINLNATL